MAYFGKTFNFVGKENWTPLVDAMPVPEDRKADLKLVKLSNKIEKNADGSYTITLASPHYTKNKTFKSGVEFDEAVIEGVNVKTTITVDGDTFHQVQKFSSDSFMTATKEFSETDLKVTLTASFWDGVAYRYYKA